MLSTSSSALFLSPSYHGYSRSTINHNVEVSNMSNFWVSMQRKIVCSCMTSSRNVSDGFSPFKLSVSFFLFFCDATSRQAIDFAICYQFVNHR